jgi:hypothetical protein
MAKWKVLKLLWSEVDSKYIHPGEIVEMSDEGAARLLATGRNLIQPAEEKTTKSPAKAKDKEE